jgi:hypothetical protein
LAATVLAGVVWVYAGLSTASGPLAHKAITPAVLYAAATCFARIDH